MGSVVVRAVLPGEAGAAGRVLERAYRQLLGAEMEEGYARHLADVSERASTSDVLVAVLGARVVGCVTYVPDASSPLAEGLGEGEAGIRMLGVDPEAQGAGVGRALVVACIDRAKDAGRTRLVLHSTQHMEVAHHLYRSLGFVREPERDWYPVPAYHLRAFALDLDIEVDRVRDRASGWPPGASAADDRNLGGGTLAR